VSQAAGVVFVDARRGGRPGEIRCDAISADAGADPLASALSPQGLLLYAETLHGRAPQAVLLTIGGESFEEGAPLSPAARRAVKWAIRVVVRQAQAWAPVAEAMPSGPESA
jgi:Ni,Fe-hydrogenase maturation factor